MSDAISLSRIARAGFVQLEVGREAVDKLAAALVTSADTLLDAFSRAGDVDAAARVLLELCERVDRKFIRVLTDRDALTRAIVLFGASEGLGEFVLRHPELLAVVDVEPHTPREAADYVTILTAAVGSQNGVATIGADAGRDALRISYRHEVLRIALFDLMSDSSVDVVDAVAAGLADLAGAAIEASIAVAKRDLISAGTGSSQLSALNFAVIGMGKCGARELNYVSDVDVIFVAETSNPEFLSTEDASTLGTKLAQLTIRGIHETGIEPGLWEVDPNLRPEGKAGALVRTLESHLAYYDRWAKNWEFQALLKARPIAGNEALGRAYVEAVAPFVWSSASRDGFVDQVQRMRERVTDNIPSDEVEWQIKLGPGGLRDIEFTVQLLQLVHGQSDESIRLRGTVESLTALMTGGYVGRAEAAAFADGYRMLRVLEHRLQLKRMSRTHLMPRDESAQRILARSSGFADGSAQLLERWNALKIDIRSLHQRLFYRPLLATVASLSDENLRLSSDQAEARLRAIGFSDARSALANISALTNGVSRRATIQRALLPVILQWLADGADPDYGLLAFRRLSEALGESHWYLRMLRDGIAAAERLTTILSGSRFITDLLEKMPEAVSWLDDDSELLPRDFAALQTEVDALLERHPDSSSAVKAVRALRRREVLRLAMGTVVHVGTLLETARGLTDITRLALVAFLEIAMRDVSDIEFAIVGMGRFGGGELSFGSDADVMFVYRARNSDAYAAAAQADLVTQRLRDFSLDARLALELDLDLRPEGRNGPAVRTLDSYGAYYERWSEVWESQALLRASPVAGSPSLLDDFFAIVDPIRYSSEASDDDAREVRRIKARVESERLPQGADPKRHLKLGRGSLSDVEWTVQLLQLMHGSDFPNLRRPSTLAALTSAVENQLVKSEDEERLREAWTLASRIRSALVLWGSSHHDTLPTDLVDLNGVARLLGYPAGSASRLEEDYLSVTRRARSVFERIFYGDMQSRRRTQ